MERKTIGGFIAALRKANGMTQRELAERLNVSDKTVSRWERDDGAPDLTLIPVLAEIFGVTCDELLRGERRSAADTAPEQPSPKGEKELRRLLTSAVSKYRDLSYISMGISLVGLIVALICNLAALRAVLGFLLGCIFFAASAVCQAIFFNRALAAVADSEVDEDALGRFRHQILRITQRSLGLLTALVGFTFPLVLMDSFVGLSPDNMLLFGSLGAAAFLLLYALVCHVWDASLLRRGFFTLEQREEQRYWARHRLRRRCAGGTVIALVVTAAANLTFLGIFTSADPIYSLTFTDPASYVAFMETRAEDDLFFDTAVEPMDYYDEQGNLISEEEALTVTEVVDGLTLTYLHRNNTVAQTSWDTDDGVFSVTVHTYEHFRQYAAIGNMVSLGFAGLYCLEVLGGAVCYLKKRRAV